jgi:hypothetical protein
VSGFRRELAIIPRTAWIIGLVIYLGLATCLFVFVIPNDPNLGKWPVAGQAAFIYGLLLILLAYILFAGYINADAKRRGMRHVMWTLLALFIPDGIGIILYFVLRDPSPKPCPSCSYLAKSSFVFCPKCGASLHPLCPSCGKGVEHGWSHCPHCGSALSIPS